MVLLLSSDKLSIKDFVPDFAMVPRFSSNSLDVIPIPLSEIVMDLAFSSILIFIFNSSVLRSDCFAARYLNLSQASDAFDISSRRNISLFEYIE